MLRAIRDCPKAVNGDLYHYFIINLPTAKKTETEAILASVSVRFSGLFKRNSDDACGAVYVLSSNTSPASGDW